MVLESDRLILRPIAAADAAALASLWRDPDVRRYLWDDELVSDAQIADLVAASERCFQDIGVGMFGLYLRQAPEVLIGFCGFREFEDPAAVELLYGIYPSYWGQGLVTEATRRALRFGFEQPRCEKVIAATDTPNQQSVRVMQRLGMDFLERKRWHGLDTVFYTLSRDQAGSS